MTRPGIGGLLTAKNAFLAALAVCVAGLIVAVLFGVLWWSSATGDEARIAEERDAVVAASESALRAYTEFDHENPQEYKENQLAVSNDEMQDQIEASWADLEEFIVENEQSVHTTVFDVAVDDLDVHEGVASVIGSLEVEVGQAGQVGTNRLRVQTEMERVEENGNQQWKLAGIDQVPVIPQGQ